MRWRWLAGGVWALFGALTIFRTVTSEFPSGGDYGLGAVSIAMGVLMASGRGPAGFVAFLGTLFAGLITVVIVLLSLGSCTFICAPAWLIAPAAAVTLANALALREITRRRRPAADGPPA